jgi:hypothetical protein
MTKEEMIEAARMIEIEMITLESRLAEPFSSNVKICAEAAHGIAETLKYINMEN